jgi:small conductance mechanosensitive channel
MFANIETNLLGLDRLQEHGTGRILSQVIAIVVLAVVAHLLVWLVHFISDWVVRKSAAKRNPVGFVMRQPKFITLTRLVASGLTFAIYFVALGYVLVNYFSLNLSAYLASASVIGLAVGFGSQGLVQDVVMGVTLIITDTLDVGDIVEIGGQVGRVERVGLRFTELTNFFSQIVYVPNRTITNIACFPAGGVDGFVDVQLPTKVDRKVALDAIQRVARTAWEQFNAIVLSEPELSEIKLNEPGAGAVLRVRMKIWPGQGALLENTVRLRMLDAMKVLEPAYADWMVSVVYRAETARDKDGF